MAFDANIDAGASNERNQVTTVTSPVVHQEVALHSVNGIRQRKEGENVQQQHQPHLEDNLRSTDMLEWCPFTSAPHAFVVFRKKLQKG